jgi:hypothetical protein
LDRTFAEFSFNHQASSNTIFTNGGDDPWKWATNTKPDASINQEAYTAECEDCGHCVDLYTPSATDKPEVVNLRKDVINFLDKILLKKK